jgi:hypothetical protein
MLNGGYVQVAADLSRQVFVDFAMSRHGTDFLFLGIQINSVISALSEQLAALRFEMLNQIASFHAALMNKGSRITSRP